MNEKIFYNALNIASDSNYAKLSSLLKKHQSWENAWQKTNTLFESKIDPRREWEKLERHKIELVLESEPEYPFLLRETQSPPFGIYVLGKEKVAIPKSGSVAIVGTRKATENGREIARNFSLNLATLKIQIVSGLAIGIDTEAHLGTIEARGQTIAVVATGLDTIYPKLNEKVAKKIIEAGGFVISEYPVGAPALPYRFLERNRIVSGLADATLVIEAPEKSGSLVTAKFAAEAGRTVYVIPGSINHPNYRGSHALIRDGAILVTRPEEIIEDLIGKYNPTKTSSELSLLSDEEMRIVSAIQASGGTLTIDKIIELTNLNAKTTNQLVSLLLIKKFIKETDLGYTIYSS
ncbi:MAG: DNA processing protein [Parcubacteria group bacterium Gr01-1014_20]|nr:MAG: DNA processing protein [Parcubacteria group bacterium Gr01-1014_20]